MPPGIQRVLIPADDLPARVGELGRQIRSDYAGRTPILVGVLKGAVVFLADLMRAVDAPCECDFIAVSSYGASTRSSGIVELTKDLSVPIEGRDVLIVEDIVDTGRTLAYLLRNLGPGSRARSGSARCSTRSPAGRCRSRSTTSGSRSPTSSSSATGSTSPGCTGTSRTSASWTPRGRSGLIAGPHVQGPGPARLRYRPRRGPPARLGRVLYLPLRCAGLRHFVRIRRDRKDGGGPGMNPFYKNLALWMVIGLVVVLLFNVFGGLSEKTTFEPNYSDFLKNVDAGLVQSVTIRGNLVRES